MFSKINLFKKIVGQIAIGLVFLFLFSLVYFYSILYFKNNLLPEQRTINVSKVTNTFRNPVSDDSPIVATVPMAAPTTVAEKISKEISSFYNFFFELPASSYEPALSNNRMLENKTLYLGSFPYTSAVVDSAKTNIRFDNVSSAIFFLPNYSWEKSDQNLIKANKNKFSNYQVNNFKGPYNDKRCLENNCLELKDNQLFYNGKLLILPTEIKISNLKAISLGTVSKKFLVGFTLENNGYQGEVFYFDGLKFSKIPNFNQITSAYFGLLGFGGEESDFLIIYGAYKGQAFRVKDKKIINLDKFFSYRPMNNGFKAEVIKVKNSKYTNWYIYSSTLNNPRFLKLWEDDAGEIIGEIALHDDLLISGKSAEFKLLEVKDSEAILLANNKFGDEESWQVFKDYGFLNSQPGTLITLPIYHNADNPEIVINKIYESEISLDKQGQPLVKAEFSVDGLNWQEVSFGKDLDFLQNPTKYYFLRLNFCHKVTRTLTDTKNSFLEI